MVHLFLDLHNVLWVHSSWDMTNTIYAFHAIVKNFDLSLGHAATVKELWWSLYSTLCAGSLLVVFHLQASESYSTVKSDPKDWLSIFTTQKLCLTFYQPDDIGGRSSLGFCAPNSTQDCAKSF